MKILWYFDKHIWGGIYIYIYILYTIIILLPIIYLNALINTEQLTCMHTNKPDRSDKGILTQVNLSQNAMICMMRITDL